MHLIKEEEGKDQPIISPHILTHIPSAPSRLSAPDPLPLDQDDGPGVDRRD